MNIAVSMNDASIQPDHAIGDSLNDCKIMGYEENRLFLSLQLGYASITLALKRLVAYCKDFVH